MNGRLYTFFWGSICPERYVNEELMKHLADEERLYFPDLKEATKPMKRKKENKQYQRATPIEKENYGYKKWH